MSMPPPIIAVFPAPRKRRSGEYRQRQIVETLLEIVEELGVKAVSAQAIADRIGLSQPAIFRHFPTKEALWLAVNDWLDERLGEIHQAAGSDPNATPLSRMRDIFFAHTSMVERHPALAKIVFSDQLRLEFPSLQQRFLTIHAAYHDRISGLVDQAVDDGLTTASPSAGATLFLSMIQGLSFQFAIAKRPMKMQDEAKAIYALFERAIGAE